MHVSLQLWQTFTPSALLLFFPHPAHCSTIFPPHPDFSLTLLLSLPYRFLPSLLLSASYPSSLEILSPLPTTSNFPTLPLVSAPLPHPSPLITTTLHPSITLPFSEHKAPARCTGPGLSFPAFSPLPTIYHFRAPPPLPSSPQGGGGKGG